MIALVLGRHVQWQEPGGKWRIGRELVTNYGPGWEDKGQSITEKGIDMPIALVERNLHVLVMPHEATLPMFVEASRLQGRPDHNTLNEAK